MLNKKRLIILSVFVLSSSFAQEPAAKQNSRRGEAAGYSSRDATALSIMGWGAGLAIGMATLSAFLGTNNSSNAHSH